MGAIAPQAADAACTREISVTGSPRALYQEGRALLAKADIARARSYFERAAAQGYSIAKVDLADVLLSSPSGGVDVRRALALYQDAWHEGVHVAAFRLAKLYELGVPAQDSGVLAPDAALSNYWYKMGADAKQPDALAHFAQLAEVAAAEASGARTSHRLLLEALASYTAAAEQARLQAWPDDAWKAWRYRRAALARALACEGLIREVADTYRSNAGVGTRRDTL
jgi:TPR repeat protein